MAASESVWADGTRVRPWGFEKAPFSGHAADIRVLGAVVREPVLLPTLTHPPAGMWNVGSMRGPSKTSGRWAARLVIVLTVGTVLGPLGARWVPQEIARWYYAAADEARLDDDFDRSLAMITEAIRWHPQHAWYYDTRAEYLTQLRQWPAALADCRKALRLMPDNESLLVRQADLLQHVGQKQRAVGIWEKIVRRKQSDDQLDADTLNGLAYHRALAGQELGQALIDINRALEDVYDAALLYDPTGYWQYSLGYFEFQRGQFEAALELLTKAAHAAETVLKKQQRRFDALQVSGRDDERGQQRIADLTVHVITTRYLRWKIHKQLNREEQADVDASRIKQLGIELDELTVVPRDPARAIQVAQRFANYLDTRGMVYRGLGRTGDAMVDFDNAVGITEQLVESFDWLIRFQQDYVSDPRPMNQEARRIRHILAVMLYHRSLAHRDQGNAVAAERDRQRVEQLGFSIDEHLF